MLISPAEAEAAPQAPATALPPVETAHEWAMPTDASTFAESTDQLFYFILALDLVVFAVLVLVVGWFAWKYRRRGDARSLGADARSGKVGSLWLSIPAALLVVVFAWGEVNFVRQSVPPADAIDVLVVGRTWFWTVEYPDYPGVQLATSPDRPTVTLVVPKGRPVRLTMTSQDVIHGFAIPAFRVKRDVVPGRYTTLWFEATRVGEFNVFCAEYCGEQHAAMGGVVKVVEWEDFERVLAELGKLEREQGEPLADFGRRVYERRSCNACHSLAGEKKTGPPWNGIWGAKEALQDGTSVTVDEVYFRESVLDPTAKTVAGYAGVGMPSYRGQLDEQQIAALIEFIKAVE